MTQRSLVWLGTFLLAATGVPAGGPTSALADPPHPIAYTNLRVVRPNGDVSEGITVLIVDGRIAEVGSAVEIPPFAEQIDAKEHTAYPGFVDAHGHLGIPKKQRSEQERFRLEDERTDPKEGPLVQTRGANRRGIRAASRAYDVYAPDAKSMDAFRKLGFATALIAPRSGLMAGLSCVVNLSDMPIRRAVLSEGFAQHAAFGPGEPGYYPRSLLGSIASFRQTMYDARWYRDATRYAADHPQGSRRPPHDADLAELLHVMDGSRPVVFEASSEAEIHRALNLAEEFGFDLVISGGQEAWRVIDRLKAANVPVIVSLKFPDEPDYGKKKKPKKPREDKAAEPVDEAQGFEPAPDEDNTEADEDEADEEVDVDIDAGEAKLQDGDDEKIYEPLKLRKERRRLWEEAVTNAIRLHEAGLVVALSTRDFDKPQELHKSLQLLIERGLSESAAASMLSHNAAVMLGMDGQLGDIAAGYLGNLTIFDKPLGDEKAKVRWVVVDGLKYDVDPDADERKKREQQKGKDRNQTGTDKAKIDSDSAEPKDESADEKDHGVTWRCEIEADRVPATHTNGNVLIQNATVIPVVGDPMASASILIEDGRITAVGSPLAAPAGATLIDATGLFVMPGIVDAHSHISADGVNEGTLSVTAEVRMRDTLRSRDVAMYRGLAGGVTSALILHGSANAIGGQSQVIKMKYGRPVSELIFEGAPATIKFALGENVTRANGSGRGDPRFPRTRMGVEAVQRRTLTAAKHYLQQRRQSQSGDQGPPLRRDLRLDAIAEILQGDRYVHCHSYRSDEILRTIAVAEDFGFRIACFQHVWEGYRVVPELARHGCGASSFSTSWAYKLEAFDAIPHNVAMLAHGGVCSSVNSDSPDLMRYLNLEAAKCIKWGGLTVDEALEVITINPARQLGIEARVGSIEVGKDGDLALFNGHPINALSRCVMTLVDGEVYFESTDRAPRDGANPAPAPVEAINTSIPNTPHHLYAIVDATVHPVSGPPIENATVVIRNHVIDDVGAGIAVPPGAGIVDGEGLHVYPGLIDGGSRLGVQEIDSIRGTRDDSETADFAPDLRIMGSVNPHSAHIGVARAVGTTTTLSKPRGGRIAGQSAVIHLDGWTMPEMIVQETFGLHVSVPSLPVHLPEKDKKKRTEEHKKQLRELEEFFAAARRYDAQQQSAPEPDTTIWQPDPDPRFDSMQPYLRKDQPVVFSASRYKDILDTIEFAEKFDLRCVIFGGAEAWKLADVLAAKNIDVILSRVNSMPAGRFEAWDSVFSCAAVLDRAGVRFCFATDASAEAFDLPFLAGLAAAHGLSPERAEYALTLGAAELLGIADRVGSIEPGKQADLIVTTHSPIQTICQVTHMFIGGRPIDLSNKQTANFERFGGRPTPVLAPPATLVGPPSLTRIP